MANQEIMMKEFSDDLNNHYNNLIKIHNCVKLLLYCLEYKIFCESKIELYSFGSVLENYIETTKNKFQTLEQEMGIYE